MLQKVAEPVPFLDAHWNQCRWPLWQDAGEPQLVCGGRTVSGKSYCCEHMERSLRREHRIAEDHGSFSPRPSRNETLRLGAVAA